MARRVEGACEESLLTLLEPGGSDGTPEGPRRLVVTAREDDGDAVIEFVAAPGEQNIEDSMTLLGERAAEDTIEREVSLRLLRHLASSVRHQQYQDTDILTARARRGRAPQLIPARAGPSAARRHEGRTTSSCAGNLLEDVVGRIEVGQGH